jgi:hypothetical protein
MALNVNVPENMKGRTLSWSSSAFSSGLGVFLRVSEPTSLANRTMGWDHFSGSGGSGSVLMISISHRFVQHLNMWWGSGREILEIC